MAETKKRRAKGEGNVRYVDDKKLWEGRLTVGVDPGTGKSIRKSIYGKTQKEVRRKMNAARSALDNNDYHDPSKLTVGQWLDIWVRDYLGDVKPYTALSYTQHVNNHIKPAIGAVKLDELDTNTIQGFYNRLQRGTRGKPALSPKTVRNIHGVLHAALQQAVAEGTLHHANPTEACKLPRKDQKEMRPLDEDETRRFIEAVKGHCYEIIFLVALFTGMRQGEVLGLTWDCVDFKRGVIKVNKQLQKDAGGGSSYSLVTTKNGKGRVITPPHYVMQLLEDQRKRQAEWKHRAGPAWQNKINLVFTSELGTPVLHHTLYHNFKHVVESLGLPEVRFHDLRHTYAVAAISAGVDIKTVQANLGHATASFTLNVYAHVTEQMNRASAEKMQQYINNVTGG